ncbi:MAG: hypothetical protein KGQ28_05510 [Hyphomicrobiales bacterium]|nr:hypothetical protein [Hyphomicrobiales bacterium]
MAVAPGQRLHEEASGTGVAGRESPPLVPPPGPAPGYEVGYGRPPHATRFQPGRSGNPAGRPRGARNKLPALNEERLKTIIVEEAYRSIAVNDGGRRLDIPMVRAVVRSLGVNAARGQLRSQQSFLRLLSETERANCALAYEAFAGASEYKAGWERELRRRKEFGIDGPEPLPHPDDVVIDPRAGTFRIKGPMTIEEKVERAWDRVRRIDDVREMLESWHRAAGGGRRKRLIEEDLARLAKSRATIVAIVGEPKEAEATVAPRR